MASRYFRAIVFISSLFLFSAGKRSQHAPPQQQQQQYYQQQAQAAAPQYSGISSDDVWLWVKRILVAIPIFLLVYFTVNSIHESRERIKALEKKASDAENIASNLGYQIDAAQDKIKKLIENDEMICREVNLLNQESNKRGERVARIAVSEITGKK